MYSKQHCSAIALNLSNSLQLVALNADKMLFEDRICSFKFILRPFAQYTYICSKCLFKTPRFPILNNVEALQIWPETLFSVISWSSCQLNQLRQQLIISDSELSVQPAKINGCRPEMKNLPLSEIREPLFHNKKVEKEELSDCPDMVSPQLLISIYRSLHFLQSECFPVSRKHPLIIVCTYSHTWVCTSPCVCVCGWVCGWVVMLVPLTLAIFHSV